MKKRRESITAAELLSDPEFQARQAAVEERSQQNLATYQRHAAELLRDLQDAGFSVESVGDLRHLERPYPDAVPILVRWLPEITDRYVNEDVIRTLSVPWARPLATRPMIHEYQRLPDEPLALKWAAANALEVIADDTVFDDAVAIATDPKQGRAREMVVASLGNMTNPRAKEILVQLLEDENVAAYALMALGKLRAVDARPRIEAFLEHPAPWIKAEARKALAAIDNR